MRRGITKTKLNYVETTEGKIEGDDQIGRVVSSGPFSAYIHLFTATIIISSSYYNLLRRQKLSIVSSYLALTTFPEVVFAIFH